MKRVALLVVLFMTYAILLGPFSHRLQSRSTIVKLGYTPDGGTTRLLVGEFKSSIAEWWVVRVLFYFGTLVEKAQNRLNIPPEYFNMYRTLSSAIQLDPYNKDAYYFAQAAFTWDVNRAREVNRLLAYGMKYRTWDWHLPFFAGFNSGYFLADYDTASRYMQKAAELSGNSLLTRLATRYYYEAGREEAAIGFLNTMVAHSTNPKERTVYLLRRNALQAVKDLSTAIALFESRFHRAPLTINELLEGGLIAEIPEDPYGGEFYLDNNGKVRSTSRFTFGQVETKPTAD